MAWTDVQPLAATAVLRDLRVGRSEPWINTGLRTKSPALQDILARDIAPGGRARQLKQELVRGDTPMLHLPLSAAPSASALGTLWAASPEDCSTMVAGKHLLRAVIDGGASSVLLPRQRQIFAQVAYVLGELTDVQFALDDFHDIPAEARQYLETDLLHPMHGSATAATWERALSAPFAAAGLTPLTVGRDAVTLFDGLTAATPAPSDGPTVSVIMPAYRPDLGLLTSLRSIVRQSHQNLEVLLVDDASGPEYAELFEQCEALDDRVTLLRMAENGGTYLARNAALRHASGDFVTVQDADDWSHPSRIGEQVRAFREHPGAGGTRSDAVRATDDLVHQWIGYSPRRRNASSLMFRRADLGRTGPFDAVRKGADSEFHERLVKLVGPVVDTHSPLAVTRLRVGTLSRGDFSYRWMSPDRQLYRAAYRSWHRTLHRSDPSPRVGDVAHRPFPVPLSFVRGLGDPPASDVDLLLILDASQPAAADAAVLLADTHPQLRVGVIHLEDATAGRLHLPEPAALLPRAARAGLLTMFSQGEQVGAATTVVLSPRALELAPLPAPAITTDRLLVIAEPPSPAGGVVDFVAATDGARSLVGQEPQWCALDRTTQRLWSEAGWHLPLLMGYVASSPASDLRPATSNSLRRGSIGFERG